MYRSTIVERSVFPVSLSEIRDRHCRALSELRHRRVGKLPRIRCHVVDEQPLHDKPVALHIPVSARGGQYRRPHRGSEVRGSRLALCAATRRVLGRGLGLLGIDAPDRM